MNWKSIIIIASAAAAGVIGAQYFFGDITVFGVLAAIGAALAASMLMAWIQHIPKDKDSRNNANR